MTRAPTASIAFLCVVALTTNGVAAEVPALPAAANTKLSGYLDALAVADLGGPRQDPQAVGFLRIQSQLARALRAQAALRASVGGPFDDGHAGIFNFVHAFQNLTPALDFNEAFVEWRADRTQIRAGIQKFTWGKLDGVPPSDVLTPRDLHDPIVRDYEESKIGIPAIALSHALPPLPSFDLSELRASLIYLPIAVPSRLPLVGERWFPQAIVPGALALTETDAEDLLNAIAGVPPGSMPLFPLNGPVRIPIDLRTANSRPPRTFDSGGIAFRLAGTVRGTDWSLSHYTGPEAGPDVGFAASASCIGCTEALAQGRLPIRAETVLRQEHDTIHMTAADAARTIGGATIRAEVAVFQNRPYLRAARDLAAEVIRPSTVARYAVELLATEHAEVPLGELSPDRDSVEWGIGIDYWVAGFLPLLQLSQVIFTDDGPRQLLSNPETRLLGSLRRQFLGDALEVETRAVYALERGAWFVHPRVSYRLGDHWRFRVGYLAIGGPVNSMIGQFRDNDELTFEARWSF